MPPESEPKTLADDFINRATNKFRPEFINNVDNPSLLADFLSCLEDVDKEVVKAQQIQWGAIHAAGILFDRLIKRPDWIDNLKNALVDPQIGLSFLAKELNDFEGTLLARWEVIAFTDRYGTACFNGNCSDINMKVLKDLESSPLEHDADQESVFRLSEEVFIDQETVQSAGIDTSGVPRQPTDASSDSEVPEGAETVPENEISFDEVDSSRIAPRPMEIEANQIPEVSSDEEIKRKEKEVELKREELRLKLIEKIFSFINNPEDVPVALNYMEKVNMHMVGLSKGSVIFSIYIGSLDALQQFEKLWRYGGLKNLLDKEMLGEDMLKVLKETARLNGHPVDNIKSELKVFETDIERCRSSLMKSSLDFRPKSFAELSMAADRNKASKETQEATMYAIELLPEELRSLLEDPFIFDRAHGFFESDSLKERLKLDHTAVSSRSQITPVAGVFKDWLNSELGKYLANIDDATSQHLITLAVYIVQSFCTDGTVAIPQEVLTENFVVKEKTTVFSSEPINDEVSNELEKCLFWGDLIRVPKEVVVDKAVVQTACRNLMREKIIGQGRGHFNFYSNIVRDAFVSKVLLCCCNKGDMKTIADSFGYVQTLIGLFDMGSRYVTNEEDKREALSCSFKTDELREIGIFGTHTLTVSSKSSFYSTDLIYCRNEGLSMDAGIIKAGEIIKKCQKAKTQKPVVDLSVPMMDKSFVLEDGLHWLNATVNGSLDGIKTSGLTISNSTVTDEDIASIGRYLNVSPSMYEISLRNCLKPCDSLRIPLEMGYFRNISHLNISDNALFEKTCRPVGLMFATSLKNLEVQNCSLGDDGLKHLAVDLSNMAHLRQLNIANNRITASGLLSLTKAMGGNKAMTGLRIHKNYFGRDGSVILASWLESLILLEVLNVSECGIGDKGSPIIASSLVSRSLKKLSMRKNELSPRGSRDFFRNFQRPPYLEHLDFSENKIFATSDRRSLSVAEDLSPTAQEEPFLDFLLQPRAMNHLSLWNTYLGQKRIFMSLNSYTCFEEMTYLCLQENNISDDFARDVCECIKLSNCIYIQHFNLRQNHIGNNGAKCIAEMLGAQKYLKEILLDRNEIGDDGANQITSASMFLPSFQFLDLSCNNISRGNIMRIVRELEARVRTGQELSYPGIKLGEGGIIQKQSSYEENNFKINREMDKFLVTT